LWICDRSCLFSSSISYSTLFGGPAQPTPIDKRGGIQAAAGKAAASKSVCSPNQYQNDDVSLSFGYLLQRHIVDILPLELEGTRPLDRAANP